MGWLQIVLIILAIALIVGIIYYISTIRSFKALVEFEADMRKDPSDEKVRDYMELYEHSFVPKNPKVQAARSRCYLAVRASDQVSYEAKKELREFFEKKGISTLTSAKDAKKKLEEKELASLEDDQ